MKYHSHEVTFSEGNDDEVIQPPAGTDFWAQPWKIPAPFVGEIEATGLEPSFIRRRELDRTTKFFPQHYIPGGPMGGDSLHLRRLAWVDRKAFSWDALFRVFSRNWSDLPG